MQIVQPIVLHNMQHRCSQKKSVLMAEFAAAKPYSVSGTSIIICEINITSDFDGVSSFGGLNQRMDIKRTCNLS